MNNITSGKAADCLADFFKRFGRTEALWRFAKVNSDAETRWRLHGTLPCGETLMRVMYFLNLVGYQVEELDSVPHELFRLAQCIACDIISPQTVSKELGMDIQSLYRYFRSNIIPTAERVAAFANIVLRNKVILDEAVSKHRKKLQQYSISHAGSPAVTETPAENGSNAAVIAGLEMNLDGVLEYGGQLLNGPKEARFAMRRKLCEGLKPKLQAAWQVLNNLLREQ